MLIVRMSARVVIGAESLVTATGAAAAFCVEVNIALVTVTGAVVDAESVVEDPDVTGIGVVGA